MQVDRDAGWSSRLARVGEQPMTARNPSVALEVGRQVPRTGDPRVQVRVLGQPRVSTHRGSVVVSGQRAKLIVGLAAAGGVLSVEEVATLLWPRERPSSWRGALRVLIHELRTTLSEAGAPGGLVQRSGPVVVFDPGDGEVEVDLWVARDVARRARDAFEAGDVAAARSLAAEVDASFIGGVLPGHDDDAVRGVRARVTGERVRNLEVLARAATALGDLATALETAEAALDLDPTNQPLCHLGLQAAEGLGAVDRGLALYARLRAALASGLGVSPSPPLAACYARLIAANGGGVWRGEPSRLPEALRARHRVVGRAPELAQLAALWGRVERGEGLVSVVVGPAGIGKTALLGELAAVVVGRGGRVLYGRESDPPAHELAAIAEALDHYRASCVRAGVACNLGALGADLESLVGTGSDVVRLGPRSRRLRLSQAVREWWVALGWQRPTLIVLDDLHWASATMAAIVADLAIEGPPTGVLLVGAARSTGPALPPTVGSLVSWGARPVELGPLTPDAVAEILSTSAHHAPRVAADIWLASGGNPERVWELAELVAEPGSASPHGLARLDVARLSPHARRIVAAVAVLGRATAPSVVLNIADTDDIAALEEARAAGVVSLGAGGLLRLRHDLLREDVLAQVGADERIRLHARAAEVLARGGTSSQLLAHHLSRASSMVSTGELAAARLSAAREAASLAAYEDALGSLEALLAERPAGGTGDLEALALRVECLSALGDPRLQDAVVELLEQAVAVRRLSMAATAAEIVTAALIPTLVGREDASITTRLHAALRRARRPEHIASLASALALSRVWTASAKERRALARRAVSALGRLGDRGSDALALATLTRAHLGSLEAAHPAHRLVSARRILALASATHDVGGVARGHLLAHDALVELGHLDEADLELQAARLCAAALDDQLRWEVAIREAGRRIMAGRLREAEEAAEQALALVRAEILREGAAAVYGAQLMMVREAEGRLAELADAFAEFRRVQEGWTVWDAAEARFAIAQGDEARAGELLVRGVAELEDPTRTDITWLARAVQYAWVAADLHDVEMAGRLAVLLAPYRGTVHWSVCVSLGPVDLLLARLLLLTDRRRAAVPLERARRLLAHDGLAFWRAQLADLAV